MEFLRYTQNWHFGTMLFTAFVAAILYERKFAQRMGNDCNGIARPRGSRIFLAAPFFFGVLMIVYFFMLLFIVVEN